MVAGSGRRESTRSGVRSPGRAIAVCLLFAVGCGDAEPVGSPAGVPPAEVPASVEAWKAQRAELDATVWADERLAREYEQTLFALWDALLAADPEDPQAKPAILGSIPFEALTIGTPRRTDELQHGISRFAFGAPSRTLSTQDWVDQLGRLAGAGYRLVQSEWHHARFEPAADGSPARSSVAVVLHVVDPEGDRRIIVHGKLEVEWSERRDDRGHPVPAAIDATGLDMLVRPGPAPFRRISRFAVGEREAPSRLHPVLLYDLDDDGRPEIVLVGANRVLWNRGSEGFAVTPLVDRPYELAETAVLSDLTGDGRPDLLAARARGDLALYRGEAGGSFPDEPEPIAFEPPLRAPSALTAGDVDGDGDLDVWLGQYKPAYVGGQMPSPYYDANDGHPAYLLSNDGAGQFTDVTVAAGLEAKRFRRSYAGSFVDLDGDGDLDLLVVSDFSGVDLYHNDGRGHFRDANDTLRSDRHLFGMSASFADYDLDGRLDFFVAGMASTTARRLEALGAGRDDRPEMQAMRMRMAHGNRMYLATDAGWREPAFAADVARTGWTWGTTAFDFDNDGDPDIFAANGNESGESTQDYCTNFWTHDIFDGRSQPDPALDGLFEELTGGLAENRESWDGYQKNNLLMNLAGRGFVNVAFLLGVADQFDSRSALSADLDLDGRVDLVVVEHLEGDGQRLHVYRNELETGHHWIGVRLHEAPGEPSPEGASVTVRTAAGEQVGRVASGETLMGQHAATLHFGLGETDRVESIEVRWVGGPSRLIRSPEIDRYHLVEAREPQRSVSR